MRKVFYFMLAAFIASFAFVSCNKNEEPKKEEEEQKEQEEEKNKEEEEVKLAIDGKFGEWASVAAVEGQDAIILTKAQADDKNLYFYLEADLASMETEKISFANYLTLVLDCSGDGAESLTYWGGETGCTYDVSFQIWLMTNGGATMANWDDGFTGKGKIENGVYKAEFSYSRSANELFKSKTIWYGMYVTDAFCDNSSGSEEWGGGELIGLAPAEGEDLAKVKVN